MFKARVMIERLAPDSVRLPHNVDLDAMFSRLCERNPDRDLRVVVTKDGQFVRSFSRLVSVSRSCRN